jgi:hypothetical protein
MPSFALDLSQNWGVVMGYRLGKLVDVDLLGHFEFDLFAGNDDSEDE